jgi:hypothetical protein
MRAVFGVVSLLIVLAVVGLLATRQLKSIGASTAAMAPPQRSAASGPSPATVREQAQQVQQRVKADVGRALEQGAAARKDEADK